MAFVRKEEAERVLEGYLKPVLGFALRRCKSSEDAEDLKELERSGMLVSVTSNRAEDETTNLVVKVEMGQADISCGLIAMLQKKNNSQIE